MEHHFKIVIELLSKQYRTLCLEKFGTAHAALKRGDDYFDAFSEILAKAPELEITEERYLEILVDECARIGRPPVPPSLVPSSIGYTIVERFLRNERDEKKAKAAYKEIVEERNHDGFDIDQLRRFRVVMLGVVKPYLTEKEPFPQAWEVFYRTPRDGRSMAAILDGRRQVPEVFKALSPSWHRFFAQVPSEAVSEAVSEAYRSLFPGEDAYLA